MIARFILTTLTATFVTGAFGLAGDAAQTDRGWSDRDLKILRSLSIGSLAKLPKDPSNAVGSEPGAAKLGHQFFFDKRLSGNGAVACATCHQPDKGFTDGRPVARGMGATTRNTPTIIGTAYNSWFFWDGRSDSQWSQALKPMEAPVEHGGARTGFAKIVYSNPAYRRAYEALFGAMPDVSDDQRFPSLAAPIDVAASRDPWDAMAAADRMKVTKIFVNIGKTIAAYERLILPGPSRFDRYVESLVKGGVTPPEHLLTDDEIAGLRLFISRGKCTQCHSGPLLSNDSFHNTGLSVDKKTLADEGRTQGVLAVHNSEFNCLGRFSDASAKACGELNFIKLKGPDLLGSFKSPTLRNVSLTAPYMHDGRFSTLVEVLSHYNQAPAASIGITDILPLKFTAEQLDQLRRFLLTLDSPVNLSAEYLSPPS